MRFVKTKGAYRAAPRTPYKAEDGSFSPLTRLLCAELPIICFLYLENSP